MAVFSKYVDRLSDKLEQSGLAKTSLSHLLVGVAIAAWTVKVTYPMISNKNSKISKTNNNKRDNEQPEVTLNESVTEVDESKLAEAEKLLVQQQMKNQKGRNLIEPGLNKEFIKQLTTLLKIMIPKPVCYETGILSVHTLCLISRTFLSIYVAALEGALVKYIVRKDIRNFAIVLLKWFGIAIPATFVNSMIRFLESKLSLAFR